MTHPATKEDVYVESFLDNPFADTYLKLFIAFAISAVIGFGARKSPWAGIIASICTIVMSVNYFANDLIYTFPFIYVLVSVTALAGNIVYACFSFEEKKVAKADNCDGENIIN